MDGLISYPRVPGDGPGDDAIAAVLKGDAFNNGVEDAHAAVRNAVDALRAKCSAGLSGVDAENIVKLGMALRDAVVDAAEDALIDSPHVYLFEVTDLYAEIWKAAHPLSSSVYAPQIAAAEGRLAQARITGTEKAVRDAQELLGILAARYELSALAGGELESLIGPLVSVNGTGYQVVVVSGVVRHLECCGAYALNICIAITTRSGRTLYFTAEAKGGRSRVGTVKGKKGGPRIRQDSLEYARHQAHRMLRAKRPADPMVRLLKNQMGKRLLDADQKGFVLHATVRMKGGVSRREHFE